MRNLRRKLHPIVALTLGEIVPEKIKKSKAKSSGGGWWCLNLFVPSVKVTSQPAFSPPGSGPKGLNLQGLLLPRAKRSRSQLISWRWMRDAVHKILLGRARRISWVALGATGVLIEVVKENSVLFLVFLLSQAPTGVVISIPLRLRSSRRAVHQYIVATVSEDTDPYKNPP